MAGTREREGERIRALEEERMEMRKEGWDTSLWERSGRLEC